MENDINKSKKKKVGKIIAIVCAIAIGLPLLTVGGYVSYVFLSYKRIGNTDLDVNNKNSDVVDSSKSYTLTSYNIGFGAYSPEYTFFMDTGYAEDGTPTKGTYGKGISYDDVNKNTNGTIETIKSLNSDFYALQEVDIDADRSYHINQKNEIETNMSTYNNTFAVNFDSAYLFYPFNDPHGKSKAGLSTLSKYKIDSSKRIEYTISNSFSKFFDLDRCFSVNEISLNNGKKFILINSHMSAYDEGGTIRDTQIKELYSYMKQESDKGNYIIAAGDYNHDLLTNNPMYTQYDKNNFAYKDMIKQLKPDWLSFMFSDTKTCAFDEGFKVYAANNEPSCRDCDITWQRGTTYVSTVDGFIVSNNITVESVTTLKVGDNGFAYSDHQPTTLKFKFNS